MNGDNIGGEVNDQSGDVNHYDDCISDQVGVHERKGQQDMGIMCDILVQTGWTDEKPDDLPDEFEIKCTPPHIVQSGAQWKAVVQKQRQCLLNERMKNINVESHAAAVLKDHIQNQVKVVDKSFLDHKFCSPIFQEKIDSVFNDFSLNKEQECSFHIVANHASSNYPEQLKMYIGGMGGTGKTQVLKAIMKYFKQKGEIHKFIVVAPTGTAAALLGGSTYHYMFGINEQRDGISNAQLAQVKSRLEGVKYIFLDEVSMLSCSDMYRISARLAHITNSADLPFGGINMIFAGDFAQLPPAVGGEGASLYSRTVGMRSTSYKDQEAAIGKALWHQITTVVILRQNMSQKSQTKDDFEL